MGCGSSIDNNQVQPINAAKTQPIKDGNQAKQDPKLTKNSQAAKPINKNIAETNKLNTSSNSKLKQSKTPAKKQSNLTTSTKSLPKQDKSKTMITTKTSNLSQSSSQKNNSASPSKVKLDIQKVVSENEEQQNGEHDINKSTKKKKKVSKKQAEENKMSGLLKIYGL